jgi:hypothetical protein
VVSSTPRPHFTPRKDTVHIVQEAGWAPGPVWTGAENLAPTRIRSPNRPARSQLLYRLSYRAHCSKCISLILPCSQGEKVIYFLGIREFCIKIERRISVLSPVPTHTHTHSRISSLPLFLSYFYPNFSYTQKLKKCTIQVV